MVITLFVLTTIALVIGWVIGYQQGKEHGRQLQAFMDEYKAEARKPARPNVIDTSWVEMQDQNSRQRYTTTSTEDGDIETGTGFSA